MRYLRSGLAGLGAVIILVVLANAVFMLYVHWISRHDPFVQAGDVRIQWGHEVNRLVVHSPLFWAAALLTFALVAWLRYRNLANRRPITRSSDPPMGQLF